MRAADRPPRKVTIGTTIHAMWSQYPGLEERLEELGSIVDDMAAKALDISPDRGLDLAVLPEDAVCGGREGTAAERSVPLEGPVLDVMGARAREHSTYLVVPLFLVDDAAAGRFSNAAAVIDRNGEAVGIYRKIHAVNARNSDLLEGGIQPGNEAPVFDCDFGKLGVQICFDVTFEAGWDALAQGGAEIVVLPTQSPQTIRPSTLALRHGFHIVTSTWRNNASIFYPTGMTAAQIREPDKVLVSEIDLSYTLISWQPELRKGAVLTEVYGDRVGYMFSEAEDWGIFWSNDPAISIDRMVREQGLETRDEILTRNREVQDRIRGGPPELM